MSNSGPRFAPSASRLAPVSAITSFLRCRTSVLVRWLVLVAVMSTGALGLTTYAAQAAPSPTPTDLGTLGGTHSRAVAVSGNVVVGNSYTADGSQHAFAYVVGSGAPMQDLDPLGGQSEAVAMSGNVVVGWSTTAGAFAYTLGSGARIQSLVGFVGVVGISGNVVAGWSTPGGTNPVAYVLGSEAPMEHIGTFGGATYATGVSGNVVVGWSYTTVSGGPQHAFAYVVGSGAPMQDLGTLDGAVANVEVSGNVVVGWSFGAGAFVYILGSGAPIQALGGLGGAFTVAVAVSGNVVVGSSYTAGDAAFHAVVWDLAAAATTSTTVTSSVNPSQVGAQVTYTATVSPAPDGGTMAFKDGATTITGCGAQAINAATGRATCQVTYSAPGTHSITAVYSGNTSFATSTSSLLTQQVAYGVKLLDNKTKPSKSGANVSIKLQLLNATQTNVSSSTIAVTITGFSPSPAPGTPPSGSFSFVTLGDGPGYQLNLKTTKYPPNTYTVSFKAGADPTTHTAQFVVN